MSSIEQQEAFGSSVVPPFPPEQQEEQQIYEQPEVETLEQAPAQEEAESEELKEAKRLGWTPKEEYTGKAEKWVDHKTFLQQAEVKARTVKILKEKVKESSTETEILKRELEALKKQNEEFYNWQRQRVADEENQKAQQKMFALEKELQDAIEYGDTAKATELTRQLRKMESEKPQPYTPPVQQQNNSQYTPAEQQMLNTWQAEHPELFKDPQISKYVLDEWNAINTQYANKSVLQRLFILEKTIQEPEESVNVFKPAQQSVGGVNKPAGQIKRTVNDLNDENQMLLQYYINAIPTKSRTPAKIEALKREFLQSRISDKQNFK